MSGQVMESAKSIVIKQLKKPDLADSPAAKKLLGKLDKSSGFPRLDISEMPESGVAQLLTSQNDQVGSSVGIIV